MTCYHPLKAYRLKNKLTKKGKSTIVFNEKDIGSFIPENINLPCGNCIGCRLTRAREWAIRCVHESSLFRNNCFITLTYDEENLPPNGSLIKKDFQLFMRRLRKAEKGLEKVEENGRITYPIRYFHCGEYGKNLKRPHHHACLFNFDFSDRVLWSKRQGVRLDRSPFLERLWPYGFGTIGNVTVQSAGYIARYVTKKVNGDRKTDHYTQINEETGEMYELQPEYITMSRRPGIAKRWIDNFAEDVYPKDFLTQNGKKFKPPKYYDAIYDNLKPTKFAEIKEKRVETMAQHAQDNTAQRLKVREICQKVKAKTLFRELENGSTTL